MFERLVEEARKLAKPSHPAGEYFLSLYYISECQLRRLKTWDRNTELTHPNFGDSYPNDLKDRITNLLKEITSAIERIGWEMDLLRALVSRESSEQNEKDNEREDSQPCHRSVEEFEMAVEALEPWAAYRSWVETEIAANL